MTVRYLLPTAGKWRELQFVEIVSIALSELLPVRLLWFMFCCMFCFFPLQLTMWECLIPTQSSSSAFLILTAWVCLTIVYFDLCIFSNLFIRNIDLKRGVVILHFYLSDKVLFLMVALVTLVIAVHQRYDQHQHYIGLSGQWHFCLLLNSYIQPFFFTSARNFGVLQEIFMEKEDWPPYKMLLNTI